MGCEGPALNSVMGIFILVIKISMVGLLGFLVYDLIKKKKVYKPNNILKRRRIKNG